MLKKKANDTARLYKLDFELTERCNNNCIHCCINLPENDLAAKVRELSTNQIKNIIRQAVELDCLSIRFTGGEPLLREDFEELYIFARRQGVKVVIFTNATLITPALAAVFKKIPPLEPIEVSVYGMKKDSYEKVTRTPGSFEKAWQGINLLLKEKIPFVVKGAYLPANKHELEEFSLWAKKLPMMQNRPLIFACYFTLRLRRDNEEKNALIRSLRISPEEVTRLFEQQGEAPKKQIEEFTLKYMRPTQDRLFSCGAGLGSGCVDAYGYLSPCLMLKAPEANYDLRMGTLSEALVNFFPMLRQKRATNPKYLVYCARCPLHGFCEQCPARAWSEHASMDMPVGYFCKVAHASALHLKLYDKIPLEVNKEHLFTIPTSIKS